MRHTHFQRALPWITTVFVFASALLALQTSAASAEQGPITEPDSAAAASGLPVVIDVLANDSDPEAGPLTLVEVSDPANGTTAISGDQVTYTSDPGFSGIDVFTYTVEDTDGFTAIGMVTVTVTGFVNNPPIAQDDFATTTTGSPVSIPVLANDSDPDGHPLAISPGALARAAVTGLSPVLQWECLPAPGSTSLADLSGHGRDGAVTGVLPGAVTGDCDGGTSMVFFSWAGANVSAATSGMPSGAQPRSVLLRLKANFAGPGDIGLFGLGTNATGNGQFSVARTGLGNDRLSFAAWGNDAVLDLPPGANLGDGIEHTIVIVYDGGTGLTAYIDGVAGPTATLFIPLATADGIVILGQTLYGAAGAGDELRQFAVFPVALSAGDVSMLHNAINAAAAYQAFTQPTNGVVTLNGNELLYTPDVGFAGVDTFTYSVSDGFGGIAAASVTVTVQAAISINQPPTANDDAATTVQGQPLLIDVLANDTDPDGDPLAISPGALARAGIGSLGTVLHWECLPAGGATTLTDLSGHGRDGAVTSVTPGTATGDCDGGTAMAFFPGSSVSRVDPGLPSGASPRSMLVRFKANVGGGDMGLFGYGTNAVAFGQFSVARTGLGTDRLYFASWANDAILELPPGTDLGDGLEHTIVIVYDGGTGLTAYVDGVAGPPASLFVPLATVDGVVTLGQTVYGAAGFGDELRQFAVFAGALTPEQVGGLHAAIDAAAAFQAFTQPANGTVTLTGNAVTYTPNPDFVGVDTFSYSVSDGNGGIAAATVTVTVTAGLFATDDIANILANQSIVVDVLANDLGDGITISTVTQPVNGLVTTDGLTVTYTGNPGFVGTDTFTYTIINADLNTSTGTVTVLVAPDNIFPVAVDDQAVAPFETPVTIEVLANDSDEDGGTLFISPGALARAAILRQGPLMHWECLPFGGSATQFDTSGNGRTGSVGGGVTPGTFTGDCDNGSSMVFAGPTGVITLANPDLPTGNQPRAALVRYKANQPLAADIPLFGYGENGVPFAQFTVSRTILGNDKLIFTSWANDLHFDLPPGFNIADGDEHTIMFVYDGNVTVYAYVDGIQSAPGILGIPLQTADDTVMLGHSPWGWQGVGDEMRQFAIFPGAISEPDAYLIHAAIEAAVLNRAYTQPQYGNITVSPDFQTVTYTPNPGYSGPDQFLYSVSDGQGGASVALVSLIVLGTVSAEDDVVIASGEVTIDVLANDTGAGLTVVAVAQGAHGSTTTDGATVTYTPNPLFTGTDTFTYTIEDEHGQARSATVTVNVTPGNTPPTAVDDAATTGQNAPVAIDVLANDSDTDGDALHVGSGSAARPTILALGPSLLWECLPAGGSTLYDLSGNGLTGTVSGFALPGTATGDCDGGSGIAFFGGAVTRAGVGALPTGNAERTVVFRFKANFTGAGDIGLFGYGTNLTNFAQFSIARTSLGNDRLIFAAWNNDMVLDLPPGTNLGDGLEHTVAVVYDGARGLTAYVDGVAGPAATLWADLDTGTDLIALGQTLYGASGAGDELRQLSVFPVALDAASIAAIHAAVNAAVPNVAFTQPANGTVTLTGNLFTYTPALNFLGTDTFTYTASDGRGGIATATVTVAVEAGVVIGDDEPSTREGVPVTVDLLANDTAPAGGVLVIVSVTQPANGTVTFDDDSATYTPNPGFSGTDTFTYTVEDGLGHAGTGTVTVAVTANGAPTGDDIAASTAAGTPIAIDVLGGVTDPEDDDLTIDSVTQGANGSVAIDGGNVVYTPNPGFSGTDSFTVTVIDEYGATLTLTVSITVTGGPANCLICVLHPTARTALTVTGNGSVTAIDGGVAVNSNDAKAIHATGNARVQGTSVSVVGGAHITGNATIIPGLTVVPAVADPFATLVAPAVGLPASPSVSVSSNNVRTISPGTYRSISVSGNGRLTLEPGVYVITEKFDVTGNGRVFGTGVVVYLACGNTTSAACNPSQKGAKFSLAGNAESALTAPTGGTYAGTLIFADRNNAAGVKLTGNGAVPFGGAVYARGGEFVATGNGTITVHGSIVVGTLTSTGNGGVRAQAVE